MKAAIFIFLLETSSMPATMDECMRAQPHRGRPVWVISRQDRTNEPWHHRMCAWRKE